MELEASLQLTGPSKTPKPEIDEARMLDFTKGRKTMNVAEDMNNLKETVLNNAALPWETSPVTATPGKPTKSREGELDAVPDDEFGDDFDGDIDFDAVELAATQSARRVEPPPVIVRKSYAASSHRPT